MSTYKHWWNHLKLSVKILDKLRRLYNLYCVGGDVKPCTISITW